jgi:antitoxin ParD1/3/4
MASVEKISIALPPEMVSLVRQAVEAGEYASSSEVIRDALRDWTHKRRLRENGLDELRRVWKQATEDTFDCLERKYQAIVDSSGSREECA